MFNEHFIKTINDRVCDNMTLTIAISVYFSKYINEEYALRKIINDEKIEVFDLLGSLPSEVVAYGVELINRKHINYQLIVCVLGAYYTDVLNEAHK